MVLPLCDPSPATFGRGSCWPSFPFTVGPRFLLHLVGWLFLAMQNLLNSSLLGALRCFEIAARHLNLTHAASELHLTVGAVSQQIRGLEDRLGRKLFVRLARGIALTADGETLFRSIAPAFKEVEAAVQKIVSPNLALRVSCTPSFAMQWLTPRMPTFYAAHSDISIRLEAEFQSLTPTDMAAVGIDVAIRYKPEDDAPQETTLMGEHLIPIVKPNRQGTRLDHVLNEGATLLQDAAPWDGAPSNIEWQTWLERAGLILSDEYQVNDFSLFVLAMNAAQLGQGICMGRLTQCISALQNGTVEAASALFVRSPASYRMAVSSTASPQTRAFARWLIQACGKTELECEEYMNTLEP